MMNINKDLFHAIKACDINQVICIINHIKKSKEIIDIDYKDKVTGSTALYYAASIGFTRGVEVLLMADSNPNIFNDIDDR